MASCGRLAIGLPGSGNELVGAPRNNRRGRPVLLFIEDGMRNGHLQVLMRHPDAIDFGDHCDGIAVAQRSTLTACCGSSVI
jgi:hypothetical protein